ncbi:hypothetical protein L6452_11067 [Arctium lappa]|uniref:Uncharacterized protein n=1 Tax=Arctium lappa TaxID=4217 RepID=A0ACB9DP01_ARCLA|nr:hypothetical protein L6452_11067 [Arctium lappa]
MFKFNLMNEAFGKRTTASPKLLIKDSPQQPSSSSIVDKPPDLRKIKTTTPAPAPDNNVNNGGGGGGRNSDVDPSWSGSPSFREYIKSSPLATPTGDEQGEKEIVVRKQGGQVLTCNKEVCRWEHSRGDTEQADKKETRIGRFRKVFQVHKATFWHCRPWHNDHPKATKKAT